MIKRAKLDNYLMRYFGSPDFTGNRHMQEHRTAIPLPELPFIPPDPEEPKIPNGAKHEPSTTRVTEMGYDGALSGFRFSRI